MTDLISTVRRRGAVAFLGVSTAQSSVNRLFPEWQSCLGADLALELHDLPVGSPAPAYREYVNYVRGSYPRVSGSLITAHKARVFEYAVDLFDEVATVARRLGEVGMVYWREGKLVADANDFISTKRVASRLLRTRSWLNGARRAVVLGGGGAGVALANTLASSPDLGCEHITVVDIDQSRCAALRTRFDSWLSPVPISVISSTGSCDEVVADAGNGALIANATGLGKDQPGSPITAACTFPSEAIAWEFNYRFVPQNELTFWQIAIAQAGSRSLTLEDGWDYFVWGWLVVMANVINTPPEPHYHCFASAANTLRSTL